MRLTKDFLTLARWTAGLKKFLHPVASLAKRFVTPAQWTALQKHVAGILGAVVVFAAGLVLLSGDVRLGKILVRSSYDWLFDLKLSASANLATSQVVIVYMDEASHLSLKQPFNKPWDRTLHANLVDHLREEGASMILFDIIFSDPGPDPSADEAFAKALRAHGKVFLGAEYAPRPQGADGTELAVLTALNLPYEPFQNAATGWGMAEIQPDADFLVRQHFHGSARDDTSLVWVAAKSLGLPALTTAGAQFKERWVNYYGKPEAIPHVSYSQALEKGDLLPGYFRDKIVLIGARSIPGTFLERRDELRSPFTFWNKHFLFMPAVEVQATQLLNLLRGDWLNRLAPAQECLVLLVISVLLGYGLNLCRPWYAAGISVIAALGIIFLAIYLFSFHQFWFPWLIPVVAQIPLALLWTILYKSIEWYAQRREMEKERHKADRRIRQQAALLDKARDAIFVFQLDGQVSFWNKSAERLYGWNAEEVLQGKQSIQFLAESDPGVRSARATVLEKGEWNGELRQETKAGAPVLVESRWTLVRDEAGRPQSILVINTDITEKKKLESQFLRTQRMESIGTLAGGIAHDLNNVLSPIMLGVELLQAKTADEHSRKLLGTIETSAKRGRDMVKQVLTFARGHEGEKSVLQLSHLIKEMNKIIKETFPKNIQTNIKIQNNLWAVNGDATQLHQILLNLCVNARDAMPDGGKITIEAGNQTLDAAAAGKLIGAQPIAYVVLSVSDTGTGIPPEILEKIFEPFFTTKEVGKGTGLGLATVMSIVKSHQGVLDLKSEVGRGTTFTIYLPAEQSAVPVEAAPPARETLLGRNELILVVDDEPAVRESLRVMLVGNGYRVLTAKHGAEAISVCAQSRDRISAVVMDMMMPVMGGATAIKTLKRQHPELRFLAMSGLLQTEKIREQQGDTQLEFLVKPFGGDKLLQSLQQLLKASSPAAN